MLGGRDHHSMRSCMRGSQCYVRKAENRCSRGFKFCPPPEPRMPLGKMKTVGICLPSTELLYTTSNLPSMSPDRFSESQHLLGCARLCTDLHTVCQSYEKSTKCSPVLHWETQRLREVRAYAHRYISGVGKAVADLWSKLPQL